MDILLSSPRELEREKLKNNKNKVNKFQRISSDHLLLVKESVLSVWLAFVGVHVVVPFEVIHLYSLRITDKTT